MNKNNATSSSYKKLVLNLIGSKKFNSILYSGHYWKGPKVHANMFLSAGGPRYHQDITGSIFNKKNYLGELI